MHCMLMDLLHGFEVLSTTEETLFNSRNVSRLVQNRFIFCLRTAVDKPVSNIIVTVQVTTLSDFKTIWKICQLHSLLRKLQIRQAKKSNLYLTRGITPKRVTGGEIHPREWAPEQHGFKKKSQRWRRCVWFDRSGNETPDLPRR